jgi:hypothetical protein
MAEHNLEKTLEHINHRRREFFRTLFIGAGVAAMAAPMMTTQSLAQGVGEDPGPGGKCDDGLVVSKKTGKCIVPKKKAPASP